MARKRQTRVRVRGGTPLKTQVRTTPLPATRAHAVRASRRGGDADVAERGTARQIRKRDGSAASRGRASGSRLDTSFARSSSKAGTAGLRAKAIGSKVTHVRLAPEALLAVPSGAAQASVARAIEACGALGVGFAALVRHVRTDASMAVARDFEHAQRGSLADLQTLLGSGGPAPRRAGMGERLRWEWLASTGALLDGNPERRLLAECHRLASLAVDAVRRLAADLHAVSDRHGAFGRSILTTIEALESQVSAAARSGA